MAGTTVGPWKTPSVDDIDEKLGLKDVSSVIIDSPKEQGQDVPMDKNYERLEKTVSSVEQDMQSLKIDMIELKSDIRTSLAEMKSAFDALRVDFHDIKAETKTHLETSRANAEMVRADMHKETTSLIKYAVVLTLAAVTVLSFVIRAGNPFADAVRSLTPNQAPLTQQQPSPIQRQSSSAPAPVHQEIQPPK